MPRKTDPSGFTVVELLVVMAVLAIIVTVGIPNFGPTIANSRATAAANDLLGALQLARSEAVRLNEPVEISPTTAGNWADGWTISRGGTPIRQRDALARVEITGPNAMDFGSVGDARPTPVTSFTFTITAIGGGGPQRCLQVTASGSTTITPGGC